MSEDNARDEGFKIFKNGFVRRLSPTHYAVKAPPAEGWQLVELKQGAWTCDCTSGGILCPHLYAAQLQRSTAKLQPEYFDEAHLKCRYCGSPDVAKCGFRYNSRGIARRFFCNDCQRKFSIPYVQDALQRPSELVWLLNEVGSLTAKLTDLLSELNLRLELAGKSELWQSKPSSESQDLNGLANQH